MSGPRVSVVMPVRDGERFLREALDSTLAQTLPDLELIVVDDGSTDATPEILADGARRDPRVRVQRQAAAGLTAAVLPPVPFGPVARRHVPNATATPASTISIAPANNARF